MPRAVKRDESVNLSEVSLPKGRLRRFGLVKFLAVVFLVIWIFIGLFVSAFIIQGTKRGMFDYVLFGKTPQAQGSPQVQAPTETSLPKIGTINIACAEKALKPESIQKLVGEYDYDINKLEAAEKAEFEKCILAPPQPSPAS